MPDKLYRGVFVGRTPVVIAEEGDSRYEVVGHFDWGYGGGGPTRLAEALVEDALGRRDVRAALTARAHTIARLPRNEPWTLFRRHLLADIEAFGGEVPDELVRAVEDEERLAEELAEDDADDADDVAGDDADDVDDEDDADDADEDADDVADEPRVMGPEEKLDIELIVAAFVARLHEAGFSSAVSLVQDTRMYLNRSPRRGASEEEAFLCNLAANATRMVIHKLNGEEGEAIPAEQITAFIEHYVSPSAKT